MGKTLYEKNFNILVLGQVISLFGSSIQRFALSLYLLDLTGSAGIFSAILALSMVPVVLISPIAGMLADRGNKKRLMIGLDSLSALLLLVYVWIVFNGQDHVLVIATVMVLLSTISTRPFSKSQCHYSASRFVKPIFRSYFGRSFIRLFWDYGCCHH